MKIVQLAIFKDLEKIIQLCKWNTRNKKNLRPEIDD